MSWQLWGAIRRTLRWIRRLILALLLPFLLLAAFGQWWLLPRLNDFREDLAGVLRDYLQVPVRIEAVTGVRDGWRLGLRLRGVSLTDPKNGAVLASFTQAAVALNLWRSLRAWRPVFSHIRLEGVCLTLEEGSDGTLRLRADTGPMETASALPEVARWLFEVRHVDIVGERLTVRRRDGNTLQIQHPYFQVRDTGSGQRLTFTAELPVELGDRFQITVERSPVDSESWGGRFELRADRLNLAGWPLPWAFAAGQAAVELQGDWQDWQPLRMGGQLDWRRAAVKREPRPAMLGAWLAQLPEGGLRFAGQRRETGWQWQGRAWFGDGRGQPVARPAFALSRAGEQWQGNIDDLRVQDVMAWVSPWLDEPARQWLASLDPRGELPTIAIRTEPAGGYEAAAQLRGVTWRPTHGWPGFENVTGSLKFAPDRGRIEFDSRKVQVDTGGLLRVPVSLDTLNGAVSWRRSADGLWLESTGLELANADLTARFWGDASIPANGEPVLDVQGRYHDVRIGQARRYLPATAMPAGAVAWLDQALIGGRIVAGELSLRGSPARLPFDRGEGVFETRFQVEDAVLDYAPGWPRLERVRAVVVFRNRDLRVEVSEGRLLDAEVETLAAGIDDLAKAVVQVKGRVKGPSASMWRTFRNSPAGRDLDENLPDPHFTGANTLDLDLTIPLDPRPNRVHGRVGLLEGGMNLPDWNIELSRLRGEVRFTEAGLEARDVQAMLRGEPIRLDLDLAGREGHRELRARLRGRLGLRALAGEPAAALEPYLSGKSAWDAVLAIPAGRRERRNEAPTFSLELNSDLRGIAVRLPEPLGKAAGEARPLKMALRPGHDALDLRLEYGADARAALELSGGRLERGELRVRTGEARLPDAPGLAVVADLPRWELAVPVAPLESDDAAAPSRRPPTPATPERETIFWNGLRQMDARIGELIVAGQSFPRVTLLATREDSGLRVELDSEALAGRVTVPDQPGPERPVNAALRRLAIHRVADSANPGVPDPRRLPPLALTAAELRVNDAVLGRLRLVAMPRADGVRLIEFGLNSERQRINASGEWQRTIGGQISRLQATLQSQALGETLTAFGYSGTGIAHGQTQAELAVEWPGAPSDFALDRLEGTLRFQVGPGQLLDVDPGMGRMVGLLNVQNLMRRITLDFSDLFQPGMGFDQISGEFSFRHGQAYTDNLIIEAPAAQIQIQGRTGLKARDYDQQITVTPRLGGTLPVAGALAGGPAVGAALFLAERLLQKGIEHVTRYRYRLKGSWDAPVLEAQQEPPPATPAKGFAGDN